MANLFSNPQQQDLFSQVNPVGAPTPIQEPAAVGRTARLAALANADVTQRGMTLVNQMDDLTAQYEELIRTVGDNTLRREAAAKQQIQQLTGLSTLAAEVTPFDADGSIQTDIFNAGRAVLAEDLAKREEYALEQQALDKAQDLAAGGDYVQAKLLLNNLELGDASQRLRDMDTKRLIVMREVEKAHVAKEDQSWFSDAVDFVMDFIPLQRSLGRSDVVEIDNALKNWYDGLFSGERARNEASALQNMDPTTYAKYIRDHVIPAVKENSTLFGIHSNSEELDLLTGLANTPAAWQVNAMDAVNNVGLVPSLKTVKGLTSIPSLLVRQGARKEAAQVMARALHEAGTEGTEAALTKNGVEMSDVVTHTTPTSVNIEGRATQVPVAEEVASEMDKAFELVKEFKSGAPTDRFVNDVERQQAAEKALKRVSEMVGRELKDIGFDFTETELADNSKVSHMWLTLGKKEGGGYVDKDSARNFAESLGYDTAELIRDESGQWFAKLRVDFAETGMYTNPLKVQTDNVAWRLLRGSRSVEDLDLANMAQVGGNKRAAFLKQVIAPHAQKFQALKPWERESLSQVIAAGTNAEQWFGTDTINTLMQRAYKRDATQAELAAYQSYRDISNIEWALRNDDLYKAKVLQGFETASFQTPLGPVDGANVLVNRNLDNIAPGDRIFNASEGIHYHRGNPLSAQDIGRLKAEGYVLVKTENAVKLSDDTRVSAFLVKGKDVSLRPVERQQLAYMPGGHIMYKGKYFGKQGRKGLQPDTLEQFVEAPGTFINGTRQEVMKWSAKMEEARLVYNTMLKEGFVDPNKIDDVFKGEAGYPPASDFISRMEDGTYRKDTPFETVFDRELPTMYNGVDPDALQFAPETSGQAGYMRTNGRMFYSQRGTERLKDYRGDTAPTLDPFQTVNKSLMNIANITSFSDYKISAVERWAKQFKQYTNLKDLPEGASDLTIFRDAVINTSDDRIKQQALAQRNIIKRNLSWKSEQDLQAEQFTRRVHEYVMNAQPGTFGAKVEGTITDWWDNKNPVMALRGMAFDMKLGLFNWTQLPLQATTMLASISLSPKHGSAGFIGLVPLRAFLSGSGTDHMLNTFVERGLHKSLGMTSTEFKEYMWSAKKSGFFDIGGSHALVNDYGPNAAISDFSGKLNRAREAGRWFFNEAERWNRGVAYHIAWKETREAFPELATKSPDFLRKVAGRAEDYSFGMSEQSGAVWQKGLMSIPTQFWAYQARMMEAMLGKTFTLEQKIRLGMVQTMMWGSAGLPVLPFLTQKYKESQVPEQFGGQPFDTFFEVADRGLADWAVHGMTGADVLVGERVGTGSWLPNLVKDIFGFGEFGEKSFAEIAGGATFSIMGQAGATLLDVTNYMMHEAGADTGTPVKPETLKRLAMNISTASNLIKSYHVFNYGTYVSNKGNTLLSDLPTEAGWATLLGFQPGEYDQVQAAMGYLKDEKAVVEDATKIVTQYRTRMINEPDRRQDIAEEINAFMSQLPPDVRQRVLRKTNRDFDESLYSSLEKQMQERKSKLPKE